MKNTDTHTNKPKKIARVSSLKHYAPQYLAAAVLDMIEEIKAKSGLCDVEFDDAAWITQDELRKQIYDAVAYQWAWRVGRHWTEFPFSTSAVVALFARFQRVGPANWIEWRKELERDYKLPRPDALPPHQIVCR